MEQNQVDTWLVAQGLAAALAVGVLIGIERGWRDRDLAEGGRVAGLRTFSLAGLLGGALALLIPDLGALPLVGGLAGLSLLLAVSYREVVRVSGNLSITTAVAMLLTFVLGALAARGAPAPALAAAVVTAVLLKLKPTLHHWLQLIRHSELTAALQLLVLSVVILPYLPDAGYGPYQAINPYQLWWAVVLIAGLSLAAHLAMRLTGAQRGVFWTGVLGGLASSTAATLTLARMARREPALAEAVAAGVLAACGMMFLRMVVLVAAAQPSLAPALGLPLAAAGVVLLLLASWRWQRRSGPALQSTDGDALSAFDLGTALGFGAFLAVMAILVPAAREWLGSFGVYALAVVSGLGDVDATVISMVRMQGQGGLPEKTIAIAVGLTTISNLATKAAIARSIGGKAVGRTVLLGYGVGVVVAVLAAALTIGI